jgi:SAM-dependent methyltransferase
MNINNFYDGFLQIESSHSNLDRYYIRTSILNALNENLKRFSGEILDIGCGKMPYKNYILKNSNATKYTGLDIEDALVYDSEVKPDFTWNGINMPFENNSFDCAFGTEVLEHCPEPEIILKELHRVLKEDAIFFFTVPFLWNLHEVPHDEYRYTPFSLQRHLENSGFKDIEIKALGGWHASLAQMLGLWVRRAPMSAKKRKVLSSVLKPFILFLIKKDKNLTINFKEGQMITGLYGIAKK